MSESFSESTLESEKASKRESEVLDSIEINNGEIPFQLPSNLTQLFKEKLDKNIDESVLAKLYSDDPLETVSRTFQLMPSLLEQLNGHSSLPSGNLSREDICHQTFSLILSFLSSKEVTPLPRPLPLSLQDLLSLPDNGCLLSCLEKVRSYLENRITSQVQVSDDPVPKIKELMNPISSVYDTISLKWDHPYPSLQYHLILKPTSSISPSDIFKIIHIEIKWDSPPFFRILA